MKNGSSCGEPQAHCNPYGGHTMPTPTQPSTPTMQTTPTTRSGLQVKTHIKAGVLGKDIPPIQLPPQPG